MLLAGPAPLCVSATLPDDICRTAAVLSVVMVFILTVPLPVPVSEPLPVPVSVPVSVPVHLTLGLFRVVLITLIAVGGQAGSTAGGVNVGRARILFASA